VEPSAALLHTLVLQVQPLHRLCKLMGPGGVVISRIRCGVINLQFEGPWLPLTGVLVLVWAQWGGA
jgi:hypothetical protein